MLKSLQWAYKLGKAHERRRIEMAIKTYRHKYQYQAMNETPKEQAERGERERIIEQAIHQILYPTYSTTVETTILDEDEL